MNECCSGQVSCGCAQGKSIHDQQVVSGTIETPIGSVPVVETRLKLRDVLDRWKSRWGIGRMKLQVMPGLYAVGDPDKESLIAATANYKPSFDALRAGLCGTDAWILVLDTKGINVWCAAGKGTFGTEELVKRIESSRLKELVTNRTLILPQLSAPGVAGHFVKVITGFRVVYGPVRAQDLKTFLENGKEATPAMRTVRFGLSDRLAVAPVELMMITKYVAAVLALLAGWKWATGSLTVLKMAESSAPLLGALLVGTLGVPAFLPLLPPRSFALKGWIAGLLWTLFIGIYLGWDIVSFAGNLLLLPAVSAFLSLNFTGSTTFTSQTGVNREIEWSARPIALSALAGAVIIGANALMGVIS